MEKDLTNNPVLTSVEAGITENLRAEGPVKSFRALVTLLVGDGTYIEIVMKSQKLLCSVRILH